MRTVRSLGLIAAISLGLVALAPAHIQRLTLQEMVAAADHAVFGEIIAKRAFRIDHPVDGPGLVFTTLTLEGRSLATGRRITVDVTYAGGWLDETRGAWNSEAPLEEETAVGRRVLVFYTWTDNMGADLAANAIHAAHGGLFRTVEAPRDTVVLGRGPGYAVPKNVPLSELGAGIRALAAELEQGGAR